MGERLGRYTVLRHLASGGMADVLLARTDGIEGFARHVVLKRIKPEHARDARFMAMFVDEARLAATLHHGNIVQVFDIGEANGEYFFAMEYLHGEDLRAVLGEAARRKQHVPLGLAIGIVAAAAAGLHHAHERRGPDKRSLGIVHRDVSPSNLLIGYDGTPKLVDFGIAKAAARQLETHSGTLKGKVAYMSPEQCMSQPVDRRSDVYALGVVLYEMATTSRLFKGDSDYLVMDAICKGKIPLPRVRRPDLPNELSVIIMKALATEPERRFQTADEMRIALEQFASAAGLVTSISGISDYMHKVFGDKPEPWLDDKAFAAANAESTSASRPTELARKSWDDLASQRAHRDSSSPHPAPPSSRPPSSPILAEAAELLDAPKTITNGTFAAAARPSSRSAGTRPPVQHTSPKGIQLSRETSTKLAWAPVPAEPPKPAGNGKLLIAAAVVGVAALAFGAYRLIGGHGEEAHAPIVAAQPGPPSTGEAPLPPRDLGLGNGPRVVGPGDPPPPAVAPAIAPTAAPTPAPSPAVVTPTPTPAPAPVPTHDVTVRRTGAPVAPSPAPKASPPPPTRIGQTDGPSTAPPIAPAPTPAPAPAPTAPAPAPEPPPVVVMPAIAKLAPATVEAVARDHAADLSKCEADGLHGEMTVLFQIDAGGHVTKKQISSALGKPKVAGCILATLARWQFPHPPSGAAEGSYTLSFQ